MEFNRPVSNPMLVGCIELMKAEDTLEHREMFVQELQKSNLQAPAIISPEPVKSMDGNLLFAQGSKVEFPMLQAPNGARFFMGFTDPVEYRKWAERNKDLPFFSLRFEDYVNMLYNKDSQGNESTALGIVINPLGANVVVPREMLAGIVARRVGFRPSQMRKTESSEPKESE